MKVRVTVFMRAGMEVEFTLDSADGASTDAQAHAISFDEGDGRPSHYFPLEAVRYVRTVPL